uniref:p10 n=1 Tax=Duck reovirus TaxID=1171667 RepID=A0A7U3T2J6_9REOV|nr:p10 [Duck reovirus]
MADGACNHATSVFGAVYCQISQNIAHGNIDSYTSWTSYLPPILGGGFGLIVLLVLVVLIVYCCKHSKILSAVKATDSAVTTLLRDVAPANPDPIQVV